MHKNLTNLQSLNHIVFYMADPVWNPYKNLNEYVIIVLDCGLKQGDPF